MGSAPAAAQVGLAGWRDRQASQARGAGRKLSQPSGGDRRGQLRTFLLHAHCGTIGNVLHIGPATYTLWRLRHQPAGQPSSSY